MMVAKDHPHPLDALVNDPSGKAPLCDEAEFAEILDTMVADSAPRLFAIVQEYGDRVDAKCAAWGMAWDDRIAVIGDGNTVHLGAPAPEAVLRRFRFGTHITPRLVWVNPDAATPPEPA
jgi:hypothetical protein